MSLRSSLALRVLTPLALGAYVVAGPVGAAPPVGTAPPVVRDHRGKVDPAKAAEAIKKSGKLSGGKEYWSLVEARLGQKKVIPAKPLAQLKAAPGALTAGGKSSLTVVGGEDLPPGFGKGFTWDRAENEALLVMFINAADPFGVSIDGLQAGDEVQILSASGIASYSEDKGNPLASSIVGLVATAANVAITAAGAPEVVPIIDAAETFAKDQFKATNAKTKRRDAFGVDPGSGHKARQEGGLLICLPEAGGAFYSGDGDHKERWIKGDGVRTDDHLPAHLFGSFFPRQGFATHNTRTVQQTGQMYVVPWDWKFDDNAGYYKVFVKLKKGNGAPPIVIERKPATAPITPKAKP